MESWAGAGNETSSSLLFVSVMTDYDIGVGASPAGPVLAGPLFRRFNYKNCVRLLQPDHFKSPSYTPV